MSKAQWIKENLKPGEIYGGIILSEGDEPDYHLVALSCRNNKRLTWQTALSAAKAAGGDLPTRRELRLLFVNAKKHFQPAWHWSNEQDAAYPVCAWVQDFTDGYQYGRHKSGECHVRPVRRILIIE